MTTEFAVIEPVIDPEVYRRRWFILSVLCLSLLVVGIDGTIVVVALPTFVRELGATQSELQWITDAYTIVFASLLLTAGSLGDRFGRKGSLLIGLVVFGIGSLASGLVDTPTALDLHARRAGSRRRVHHAGDALDPHQRLPRRGARPRHRDLGRRLRARRRDRTARRRLAARALLVGIDLPRQPARDRLRAESRCGRIVPDSRDPHAPRIDFPATVLSITALDGAPLRRDRGPEPRLARSATLIAFGSRPC